MITNLTANFVFIETPWADGDVLRRCYARVLGLSFRGVSHRYGGGPRSYRDNDSLSLSRRE
jgi:hypothetical protein